MTILCPNPSFSLAAGCHETWPRWRCLDRLRAQEGCCKVSLFPWGTKTGDTTCDCGTAQETMDNALQYPDLPQICSIADLMAYNPVAVNCVDKWTGKLWQHDDGNEHKKKKSLKVYGQRYISGNVLQLLCILVMQFKRSQELWGINFDQRENSLHENIQKNTAITIFKSLDDLTPVFNWC